MFEVSLLWSKFWSKDGKEIFQKIKRRFKHFWVDVFCKYSDIKMVRKSFIIISDCNTYDGITVAVFIQKVIAFLRCNVDQEIRKIIFMSDGVGSQYKNKYGFINLVRFEMDYGIKVEWYFYATSHGKDEV